MWQIIYCEIIYLPKHVSCSGALLGGAREWASNREGSAVPHRTSPGLLLACSEFTICLAVYTLVPNPSSPVVDHEVFVGGIRKLTR